MSENFWNKQGDSLEESLQNLLISAFMVQDSPVRVFPLSSIVSALELLENPVIPAADAAGGNQRLSLWSEFKFAVVESAVLPSPSIVPAPALLENPVIPVVADPDTLNQLPPLPEFVSVVEPPVLPLPSIAPAPELLKNGSMKGRVGEKQKGYRRHKVPSDGDCGFTAFGIRREDAFRLLELNIANEQVMALLKPAIAAALLVEEGFYTHIKSAGVITQNISFGMICSSIDRWASDLVIARAYIQYDIQDKEIDLGWAHPGILQALAHIKGIKLRIWSKMQDKALKPHKVGEEDYSCYTPVSYTNTIDLLFVNGDHFDRLELIGYGDDIPTSAPIYPLNSSWNLENPVIPVIPVVADADTLNQLPPLSEFASDVEPPALPLPSIVPALELLENPVIPAADADMGNLSARQIPVCSMPPPPAQPKKRQTCQLSTAKSMSPPRRTLIVPAPASPVNQPAVAGADADADRENQRSPLQPVPPSASPERPFWTYKPGTEPQRDVLEPESPERPFAWWAYPPCTWSKPHVFAPASPVPVNVAGAVPDNNRGTRRLPLPHGFALAMQGSPVPELPFPCIVLAPEPLEKQPAVAGADADNRENRLLQPEPALAMQGSPVPELPSASPSKRARIL